MSLQLGPHVLDAVETGTFALDGGAMFGVVPKTLWEKRIRSDDRNRIGLAARALLIQSGGRKILVDTGLGDGWTDKERAIYAISPNRMDAALGQLGLRREHISDVVLSHLHFDHAGGALDASGQPAFPRAAYRVQRRQWEWAMHPTDRDRGSFRIKTFTSLETSGALHLLDGETELYSGIRILVSNGHTPGQQLVRVESDDGVLTFCSDLIPTSAHLAVAWGMGYDLHPLMVLDEKKMLIAEALEERGILFFDHDPDMQACRLREEENGLALDRLVVTPSH